ncbi:MAG TPA: VOC family protein [Trebonia sp.]|nr:VOC family protein [Trebonia sp.]
MESETAHTGYRQGVHHIALTIPPGTQAEVRAFYGGLLGMTEISSTQDEGGCHFRSGDMEFDFDVELGSRIPRQAHPGTLVPDIDALAARLTERGVTIEWDDKFPGYRRFYARDPLGNRLQFLQPIAADS